MQQVYLVTGAGHFPGIGANTAKKALELGNKVIVSSREVSSEWSRLIAEYDKSVTIVQGDIKDITVQQRLEEVVNEYGRLDVLVHNAANRNSVQAPTYEDWTSELHMNVIVPYELTMRLQSVLATNKGSVMMIGSRSGLMATTANAIGYSTTKAAMHHLTKELALRLSPHIRVNCIAPGLTMSDRILAKFNGSEDLKSNIESGFYKNSLLNRTVDPDDIANMIITLANSKSTTGQVISIDCGASL